MSNKLRALCLTCCGLIYFISQLFITIECLLSRSYPDSLVHSGMLQNEL